MDSLGTLVLGLEILLLVAGWLLFQQAKSDLTARAAQIPVLTEVKALQKSIASLLEQLKLEANQSSAQLEARCTEARDLLTALDRRLEEMPPATVRATARRREAVTVEPARGRNGRGVESAEADSDLPTTQVRYQQVYALADEEMTPADIAQQTGFSEGEVELILGLRRQAS